MNALACRSYFLIATIAMVVPSSALAQTAEEPAVSAQEPVRPPPPGEEVMRPTQRALRLTPGIARGVGRLWMQDRLWKDMDLTEDQERRMADSSARRMMDMAHRNGPEGQAAFESLVTTMIVSQGKINAENCREYADKIQPLTRACREFMDGIETDARGVLNAQQLKQLQTELDNQRRAMDRLDRRLANYREGRIEGEENPFDELEVEEQNPSHPRQDERIRNARRSADWEIRQTTTWNWSNFLAGAGMLFKFDDGQKAKGQALLQKYQKQADAIRTPEWKERMRYNRAMVNLQWQLGGAPKAPWVFRLNREWREANRPVEELSNEFYREVLALATAQQRADAVENTRGLLEKHGLTLNDADMADLEGLLGAGAEGSGGGGEQAGE